MRSGEAIKALILEISPSQIKYKKASRPNGPDIIVDKSDVLSITYEDGETELFGATSPIQPIEEKDTPIPTEQEATPSSYNQEMIDKYNKTTSYIGKKNKDKKSSRMTFKLGLTKNSVLASEDLLVTFELRPGTNAGDEDQGKRNTYGYSVRLTNLSDKPIYGDTCKSLCLTSQR